MIQDVVGGGGACLMSQYCCDEVVQCMAIKQETLPVLPPGSAHASSDATACF